MPTLSETGLLWNLSWLLFFLVPPIAVRIDCFFHSVADFLASSAKSFSHFLTGRHGFTFHHFVRSLLAPLPDFLASAFKAAAD